MGLASINIKFKVDLSEFSSQMQNAVREIDKAGQKMQSVGAGLSAGITLPLLGLGAVAVNSAADLETLKTSLDTVFKGNSQAAENAFNTIKEFASSTPYAVEEVTQAFIKLKNLGLNASESSLRSYGNTASALGKSLDQMIEAVADASVGEFERLKEFGIKAKSEGDKVSFTFQGITTTVGKNSAEIESYLANVGNVNFAGAMEKQSQTFTGRLSNLKDNVQSAFSSFGEIILEALAPMVEWLGKAAAALNNLDPSVKKVIVVVGGLLAAAGPLILAFGTFASMIPTLIAGVTAIGGAFTVLTGPIGLVVVGIGALIALIIKNWGTVKKYIVDTANYFIDLYNSSMVVRLSVEAIITTFKNLWEAGKFVVNALIDGFKLMGKQILNVFSTIGDLAKAILTGNFKSLPEILKKSFDKALNNGKSFVGELGTDFSSFTNGVKNNINDALSNINSRKFKLLSENVDTEDVENSVASAVSSGLNKGLSGKVAKRPKLEAVEPEMITQSQGTISYYENEISRLKSLQREVTTTAEQYRLYQKQIDALQIKVNYIANEEGAENVKLVMGNTYSALQAYYQQMHELNTQFGEATANIMETTAENLAVGFGQFLGALASGGPALQGLYSMMMNTISSLMEQLGKAAIQIGITMSAIKASFKTPGAAIAAGIALIALSSIIKSFVPKDLQGFKDGGIVGGNSYYGDKILARVNSGELILNQSQQKSMWDMINPAASDGGVLNLDGVFEIKGSDLELVIDRAIQKNNRLR